MQRSYNKLLGRIVEIFGTRGAFGKSMGWSDRTTSLKLNGKVDWKQDEIEAACQAFRAVHPDCIPNVLNCASVYSAREFEKTKMFGPGGNFGLRCRETITLNIAVNKTEEVIF